MIIAADVKERIFPFKYFRKVSSKFQPKTEMIDDIRKHNFISFERRKEVK